MYVTPDLYNWTLYFIFKFVYFSGKGLESNISKEVLPLNQPFSPLSSPLKKKKKKPISHLNYFMDHHFSTKEQKLENLHVMKKQNKKETLSLICPALSSQVWKKSRTEVQQRANKKEKSGHPPSPPKKKYKFGFFPEWKKENNNVV